MGETLTREVLDYLDGQADYGLANHELVDVDPGNLKLLLVATRAHLDRERHKRFVRAAQADGLAGVLALTASEAATTPQAKPHGARSWFLNCPWCHPEECKGHSQAEIHDRVPTTPPPASPGALTANEKVWLEHYESMKLNRHGDCSCLSCSTFHKVNALAAANAELNRGCIDVLKQDDALRSTVTALEAELADHKEECRRLGNALGVSDQRNAALEAERERLRGALREYEWFKIEGPVREYLLLAGADV